VFDIATGDVAGALALSFASGDTVGVGQIVALAPQARPEGSARQPGSQDGQNTDEKSFCRRLAVQPGRSG